MQHFGVKIQQLGQAIRRVSVRAGMLVHAGMLVNAGVLVDAGMLIRAGMVMVFHASTLWSVCACDIDSCL